MEKENMKIAVCHTSTTVGSVVTVDSVFNKIMEEEKSAKEFTNLWAKFMLNDFMGMLKKKKKTIKDAPRPDAFKHMLIAHYYGKITRNELRKYVENLI
jgi:Asp-tRNA(Asn)/Glu-tRNA(Gln) amidotransferase B subunit